MVEVKVTDSNFDEEVVKATQPVLVDFWAEWCVAPQTHIYKNNLESITADKIKKGDSLVGWNDGKTSGIVSYSKTTKDGGHCREIRTVSGRNIKLTDDHLVFTDKGWVRAQYIKSGDKVAVLPVREPISFKSRKSILVDEIAIKGVASSSMRTDFYISDLRAKGFLPLREDHPQILRLARLTGFLFSDGSLYQGKNNYREISFVLGRKEDVEVILSDLKSLGIKNLHVSQRSNKGKIGNREFTMHSFRVKCLSTSLFLLFRALGVPEGSKINQKISIPNWVKAAPLAIKREFLAALLGGDGPKLAIHLVDRKNKLPYNHLSINDYEFHKREDLIKNGLEFASDLRNLFAEFDVKIRKIFSENETYTRKDKSKTVTIHLCFAHDFNTGYNLAQKIGYSYSKTKEEAAGYIGEFLKILLKKREKWQSIYAKALKLARQGQSAMKIAERLYLSYDTIFGWVKLSKKATVSYHLLKFPDWLQTATKGLGDGFLWQNVENIKKIYLPAVQKISVNPTHNFIANGFLVHNCGPCRMQDPILEEVAKEYEGKIKIAKLNVDENPATAAKYTIMSIPTLLLFKGGIIVKQMIGVQSKETLVEEFKKVLQ